MTLGRLFHNMTSFDIESLVSKLKELLRVKLGIGKFRLERANIKQDIKDMFQQEQEEYSSGEQNRTYA